MGGGVRQSRFEHQPLNPLPQERSLRYSAASLLARSSLTPTHGLFQSNSFICCAAKLNSAVPVSRKVRITATTALPAGA